MLQVVQMDHILASVIYSFLGLALLVISFILVDLITPGKLWKEIVGNKNTAVAIVAAAFILSIAIIISSAILG